MLVREAKKSDVNELAEIYYQSRRKHFTWLAADYFSLADYQEATIEEKVWVVEKEQKVIGFLSVYEPDNFIHLLFIKPGNEGQGVGRLLLSPLFERQTEVLTLKCLCQNISALAFYQKMGFEIVSQKMISDDGLYYLLKREITS